MAFLLDTNVLSELQRSRPNPGVLRWLAGTPSSKRYVSALCVGEIRRGIEAKRRRDAARAVELELWLEGMLTEFHNRIVDVDLAVSERWAEIDPLGQVPAVDCLIAATALVRGWTVISRNERDFVRTGVALLNPFEAA
jgi:hypothetical protein